MEDNVGIPSEGREGNKTRGVTRGISKVCVDDTLVFHLGSRYTSVTFFF